MKPKLAAEDPVNHGQSINHSQEHQSVEHQSVDHDESVVDSSMLDNSVLSHEPHARRPARQSGENGPIKLDVTVETVDQVEPVDETGAMADMPELEGGFDKQAIPDIVIGRLPVYLRTLKLLAAEGQEVASSQELGERLGISSAQIRKDLSHFGEFGKQGTGYNVAYLCRQLEKILKVDCIWPVVLVGAGYLGHALASYNGFENRGFRIVAVFDSDPRKIGTRMGNAIAIEPISNISQAVRQSKCQIAIIAVPAEAAQPVADQLIEAGIKSVLCYAPITLTVPKHIRVQYIDPVIHFQHMTFYLEKGCIDS